MIIISINGGLGNQLFQYAFGKHLEHIHQENVYFDLSVFDNPQHRDFALNHFDISLKKAKSSTLPFHMRKGYRKLRLVRALLNRFFYPLKIVTQAEFDFNPLYLSTKTDAYYWGYWQSEKYFAGIKNAIRRDLSFEAALSELDIEIRQKIERENSISLHVRRGDYLNHPLLPVCELSYYQKAIEIIRNKVSNPYFFIFSDDITWCKENIKLNHPHDFIDTKEPIRDLRLMTFCKHNIIANSSFSWWGAYLGRNNDKIVISPKKWFIQRHDKDKYCTKDLIPESWMII